jgi:hypothetical protein
MNCSPEAGSNRIAGRRQHVRQCFPDLSKLTEQWHVFCHRKYVKQTNSCQIIFTVACSCLLTWHLPNHSADYDEVWNSVHTINFVLNISTQSKVLLHMKLKSDLSHVLKTARRNLIKARRKQIMNLNKDWNLLIFMYVVNIEGASHG